MFIGNVIQSFIIIYFYIIIFTWTWLEFIKIFFWIQNTLFKLFSLTHPWVEHSTAAARQPISGTVRGELPSALNVVNHPHLSCRSSGLNQRPFRTKSTCLTFSPQLSLLKLAAADVACPPNVSFSHCIRPHKQGGGVTAIFTYILFCESFWFDSCFTVD